MHPILFLKYGCDKMPVDETVTGCIVNAVPCIVIFLIVLVVHFYHINLQ